MPLRKPVKRKDLPKTRKKKIEKIKKSIPVKKKPALEYIATAFFRFDPLQKKQFYIIAVSTVQQFTSLNYQLAIDVIKNKQFIDINLLGLNTLQSYFIEVKPAATELFFENLFGEHTISFIKRDGSINTFVVEFNIFKKSISVKKEIIPRKKNNHRFMTFTTAAELYTFAEKEVKS